MSDSEQPVLSKSKHISHQFGQVAFNLAKRSSYFKANALETMVDHGRADCSTQGGVFFSTVYAVDIHAAMRKAQASESGDN